GAISRTVCRPVTVWHPSHYPGGLEAPPATSLAIERVPIHAEWEGVCPIGLGALDLCAAAIRHPPGRLRASLGYGSARRIGPVGLPSRVRGPHPPLCVLG